MNTSALFERFYFSRPEYVSGTVRFHGLISDSVPPHSNILEVGSGPSNPTSQFLSTLGPVTGIDIELVGNESLAAFNLFNGIRFPVDDCSFDVCVSNYVLEHVPDTEMHFREVFRVLKSGGLYFFRTPNVWHYVAICSRLLPHSVHLAIANKLRGLKDAHEPYPTLYHANSLAAIKRLARESNLVPLRLEMVEAEPSYGAAHPVLFYPMMAYERIVNRFERAAGFRANILGVIAKT
jgi:SAM-dependent methyltransferase